jgi:hypothetical protein
MLMKENGLLPCYGNEASERIPIVGLNERKPQRRKTSVCNEFAFAYTFGRINEERLEKTRHPRLGYISRSNKFPMV